MNLTWYVAAPLVTGGMCIAGGIWGVLDIIDGGASAEVCVMTGIAFGLGVTGIIQSIYRSMLQMQDEEIEELQAARKTAAGKVEE